MANTTQKNFDIVPDGTGSNTNTDVTYNTATFKRYNGTSWDIYYFKTLADLVGVLSSSSTGYADSKQFVTGTILNNLKADTKYVGTYATQNWTNATLSSYATTSAMNTAITTAISGLDATTSGWGANKTIASLTETDGKISATAQDIQIAKSQVTNLTSDLAARPSWGHDGIPATDAVLYYDAQGEGVEGFVPTSAGYLYVNVNDGAIALSTSTPDTTVKTLNTTATTAQTTSSNESIKGSGTITLHKISKTGNYNDLLNKPTIPTVNNGTLTLKAGSTSKTFTANSANNVTFEVTASDLGLSGALQYIGEAYDDITQGSTTNPVKIVIQENPLTTKDVEAVVGNVVTVFGKGDEYLWTSAGRWISLGDGSSHALKTTKIEAGTGLKGGGDLSANRTINLKTASASEIGGIAIGYPESGKTYAVKLSNNKAYVNVPWENTHYSSSTIVGASNSATANAAASNGSVYLNHIENGSVQSAHLIKGTNAASVTSDTSGVITISATNTSHSHEAGVGLTGTGSSGTSGGTYTYNVNLVDNAKASNAASYTAGAATKFYAVQLDKNDKLGVYVPWTDTTYSAGTRISLSGTTFSTDANKTFTGTSVPTGTLIAGDVWFDTTA